MTPERRAEDRLAHKALNGHTHPEISDEITKITDILQGPEELGGGRNGGLVAQVDRIEQAINGGIETELNMTHKIAILVAAIGGLASLVSVFG